MSVPEVRYERSGATAVITVDRPSARNAMTFAMYEALHERCEEADADPAVRVLVLRGAGGAFVAGTDIAEFLAFSSGEDGVAYEARIERVIGRIEAVGKPTVAVIEGPCVGGGLAMAAACDLRLCTSAAKFAMPIARTLGNCLSMANVARLVALIGPARTLALVYTAGSVSAEEALAAGLATKVVEAEELEVRLGELCERVAAQAPITLRVTKEAVHRLRAAGLPEGEDLVREAYGSDDFHRAVKAFTERRAPEWHGR